MLNLFLLGNFICPSVFLLGSVLMLTNFAKKDKLSHLWISIPVVLAIVFAAMFFLTIIYDTSGILSFLLKGSLTIALVLSFLTAIIQGTQQKDNFGRNTLTFYLIGSILLVPVSSGIGVLGSDILVATCETYHLRTGDIIVHALENYYGNKQEYPNNLLELSPQYLDENSIKTCFSMVPSLNDLPSSQLEGFYYKKCSSGITQLSVPEMGTGHFHIYDLDDKQWFTSRGDTLEEWGRVTLCPQ